jgi:type IV pilus assembly protein PilA
MPPIYPSGPGGPGGPMGPPGWYPPPPPQSGKSTWAIVLIGCLIAFPIVIAVIGILAAIAIPDFLKFNAKAKQAEAKTNLGAIYTTQAAYFAENNVYAGGDPDQGPGCFEQIGWSPEGDTSYCYYCGEDVIKPTKPYLQCCPVPKNLSVIKKNSFVIMAVGNVDRDSTCDVWTIDNNKQLINVTNDVGD